MSEALEGLFLMMVILERESVLAVGRSLLEMNLLYETGRLVTTFSCDGWLLGIWSASLQCFLRMKAALLMRVYSLLLIHSAIKIIICQPKQQQPLRFFPTPPTNPSLFCQSPQLDHSSHQRRTTFAIIYITSSQLIMNKYKTISNSYRQSLQQTIEKRLFDNTTNRKTLDCSLEEPLMSNNKSIVYIKLPKRNQLSSSLRNSLYQSSLKRMKQLKSNLERPPKIPDITQRRKRYEEFQEEIIRQCHLEKEASSKALPNLHTITNKIQPYKSNYNIFLQQKSIEQSLQHQRNSKDLTINTDNRPMFFEAEESAFGYRNLKEKYLKSKQSSLNNKRRLELAEKNQSSSQLQYYQQDQGSKNSPVRFKMNKAIEDHMNRYNQKDLFHARLKGFKTNLHTLEKTPKVRHIEEHSFQSQFSNFVKRKKLKSVALYQLERSQKRQTKLKVGFQDLQTGPKVSDCTPWQTDLSHFQ